MKAPEGAVGERKLGSGVRVTTRDKWHLGSCTKAMTATLIARLVERKLLAWDTTVGAALGDVFDIKEAYRPVTITELLQHRGGLIGQNDASQPAARRFSVAATSAGDDAVSGREAALRVALSADPGGARGEYLYSNAGYLLAGHIVERLTGTPYERLLADEVFTPLGMTESGFGPPASAGDTDQPWPHRAGAELLYPRGFRDPVPIAPGPEADNSAAVSPSGRAHATLRDWAAFVGAHTAGTAGATSYLSAESWTLLHTPPPRGKYAMGWGVIPKSWRNELVWSHAGSNTMNYAVVTVAPRMGLAVLVACNQAGKDAEQACGEATEALAKRYAPPSP